MNNDNSSEYAEIVMAVENYENEADEVFLKSLHSSDPYVVWHGIKGCGMRNIRGAVPKIIEILGTPCAPLGHAENTDLRRIAAWALGKMGYDSFSQYLEEIEHNPNALFREGVADALGNACDPRAAPILDILLADEDRNVVLWSALALAKLGEVSIPVIERHLLLVKEIRRAAYLCDALKKIGTARALAILGGYLKQTPFKELILILHD
jgi:HEAT repeat protein